jgi:hypothetical protein
VAVTVGLAVGLTGCANGAALGLVQQACHHVKLSLTLYRASLHEPDTALAAHENEEAAAQLQAASPLATEAAGEAPQWQALMATLAENSRLPESALVSALQEQCASVANGGNPGAPTLPATTLPAPPGPSGPG